MALAEESELTEDVEAVRALGVLVEGGIADATCCR